VFLFSFLHFLTNQTTQKKNETKRVVVSNLVTGRCSSQTPRFLRTKEKNPFFKKRKTNKKINRTPILKLKNSFKEKRNYSCNPLLLTTQGYACCPPTKF
jgi:hypothetical protein